MPRPGSPRRLWALHINHVWKDGLIGELPVEARKFFCGQFENRPKFTLEDRLRRASKLGMGEF